MVHHDLEILLLGQVDQFFAPARDVAGERLLDKDVLAVFERGLGKFEVGPDR